MIDSFEQKRDDSKLRSTASSIPFLKLPVGYYLVTREGYFVECSGRVRQILNIAGSTKLESINIRDFYVNPADREKLLRKLTKLESEGKFIEREVIAFKVENMRIYVEDYCRTVSDSFTNETLGYLGCLVEVTEDEIYRELSQKLSAAICRVDETDQIVFANAKMHALFESEVDPNQLIGRSFEDFLLDGLTFRQLREKMHSQSTIVDALHDMRTTKGTHFKAHITLVQLEGTNELAGRINDVTEAQQYKDMLEEFPVGTFMWRNEGEKHTLLRCNDRFAKLLDFDSKSDIQGKDISEVHGNLTFLSAYIAKLSIAKELSNEIVTIETKHQRKFTASLFVRLIDLPGGTKGRVGGLVDVSQEYELKRKIDDLTHNVSQVLHTYSQTINMVRLKSESTIAMLSPDPFGKTELPTFEFINRTLTAASLPMRKSLERIVERIKTHETRQDDWSRSLQRLDSRLAKVRALDSGDQSFFPQALSRMAVKIGLECRSSLQGKVPRELLRQLEDDAWTVARLAMLVETHYLRDRSIEISYEISSLRDFITSGFLHVASQEIVLISDLVNKALTDISDFAINRRIDVRRIGDWGALRVKCNARDMARAITNVLHNAVKYSWTKKDERSWITISVQEHGRHVFISVENRGVAIPQREIDDKLIFKMGVRGILSFDRNRVGTGVGLADTKKVLKDHHGDIEVVSRPSSPEGNPFDYSQPFITLVTLKLERNYGDS